MHSLTPWPYHATDSAKEVCAQLTPQTPLPTTPQTLTPQNSSQGSVEPHTPESPSGNWSGAPILCIIPQSSRLGRCAQTLELSFPVIFQSRVSIGVDARTRLPHLKTQQGRACVGGTGGKTISKRHTYFCESSPENKEKTAPSSPFPYTALCLRERVSA